MFLTGDMSVRVPALAACHDAATIFKTICHVNIRLVDVILVDIIQLST
jgi:hypothetical protein